MSALALALTTSISFAQVTQSTSSFPDRSNGELVRSSALETFKADFGNQEAGILHVYIDPSIDPEETYLFTGQEASGTTKALLPVKFQRMAQKMEATIYATRAIKLMGVDDHYLIRFDGTEEDRIELFVITDDEVKHVTTLATRKCANDKCVQTDTWITDIDGDTNSELIFIDRMMRNGEVTKEKKMVKTFAKGKWKKSKELAADAPWSTVEFFEEN